MSTTGKYIKVKTHGDDIIAINSNHIVYIVPYHEDSCIIYLANDVRTITVFESMNDVLNKINEC